MQIKIHLFNACQSQGKHFIENKDFPQRRIPQFGAEIFTPLILTGVPFPLLLSAFICLPALA